MGLKDKKTISADLGVITRLKLDWGLDNAEKSLNAVFEHVMDLTDETINWYLRAKRPKRLCAASFRALAIVLVAIAALLPTLGELFPTDGKPRFPAGWTAILLGGVGVLLLLDRFFGFSTGWMRYMSTELQLRQMAEEFLLEWEMQRAGWEGRPTTGQAVLMMARFKTFASQVNLIVLEETNAWRQEFESAIKVLDERAKLETATQATGAMNLTVTNGDGTTNGWDMQIDGGLTEHHKGRTLIKRNLATGTHQIEVKGEIDGRTVHAGRVVNVPPMGMCEETVTLD